jgi:proteasome assembly chaperone (PAC2) family protein
MTPLYERHEHEPLDAPVLLLATDSWVDAGMGAAGALAHVLDTIPTEPLATFDADSLIDFRARRPTVRITDGVVAEMSWPVIQLRAGRDAAGQHLLALVGPEPDMAWHAFVAAVVELASELGVRLVVSAGAYPAAVPHTRPVRLTAIATNPELAAKVGIVPGSSEVPAGIQTALQQGLAEVGIPAVGIWARVPHYLAATPFPAASAALVEALADVTGLALDAGELRGAAEGMAAEVEQVIANSDEGRGMIEQLEAAYDTAAATESNLADMPSGDELAAELERFLRDQP